MRVTLTELTALYSWQRGDPPILTQRSWVWVRQIHAAPSRAAMSSLDWLVTLRCNYDLPTALLVEMDPYAFEANYELAGERITDRSKNHPELCICYRGRWLRGGSEPSLRGPAGFVPDVGAEGPA